MSRGQHGQANHHAKFSTRGERMLAKAGLRVKRTPLKVLARQLQREWKGKQE